MRENEIRIPTVPQVSTQKQRAGEGYDAEEYGDQNPILSSDMKFTGEQGGEFEIYVDKFFKIGGESQIYLCKKTGDSAQYVAKIYTLIRHSKAQTKRRVVTIKFLLKSKQNKGSHIMPLEDYGEIDVYDGKYQQYYYIEVYPYCTNGDLSKAGQLFYETLVNTIIPAVNTALNEMHEANLINRDIKPENLYWYNGDVVIGDFGITSEANKVVSTFSSQQRGTLGYSAPELLSGLNH
jgi:serine/threonine protein kinase